MCGSSTTESGKGLELFDGTNLGRSSFAEQVNFRRGLQGELARSITAMAQVQGARVHLALGKHSVFKDRDEAATASVALHLHAGQRLTPDQVSGIRQLVAASVEGVRPDAVVVVDNHGNLLAVADPTAASRPVAIEQVTTARVRQILERVVGPGRVSVVTTAVVDDSQISETQELFDNANPVEEQQRSWSFHSGECPAQPSRPTPTQSSPAALTSIIHNAIHAPHLIRDPI